MGNNASVDCKEFCIRMDIENSTFFAGEEVSGTVYLYIKSPLIPGPLSIQLSGKEQNYLCSSSSNLDSSLKVEESKIIQKRETREKYIIRKSVFKVCEWTRTLRARSYLIPFRFILPLDLPGTLQFKNGQIDSSIIYTLKAQIPYKDYKVYSQNQIIIRQEPAGISNKHTEKPSTEFFGFCRRSKGICKVVVKPNPEPYSSSKTGRIVVEIDNTESLVFIKVIEVSLYFVVSLKTYEGKKIDENKKIFSENRKVSIRPGEKRTGVNAVEIEIDFNVYKKQLSRCPSVEGLNIQSFYMLTAKPKGSVLSDCLYRCPQSSCFIQINPVMDIERIVPWKPMYCEAVNYETVELKEYKGEFVETESQSHNIEDN